MHSEEAKQNGLSEGHTSWNQAVGVHQHTLQ